MRPALKVVSEIELHRSAEKTLPRPPPCTGAHRLRLWEYEIPVACPATGNGPAGSIDFALGTLPPVPAHSPFLGGGVCAPNSAWRRRVRNGGSVPRAKSMRPSRAIPGTCRWILIFPESKAMRAGVEVAATFSPHSCGARFQSTTLRAGLITLFVGIVAASKIRNGKFRALYGVTVELVVIDNKI